MLRSNIITLTLDTHVLCCVSYSTDFVFNCYSPVTVISMSCVLQFWPLFLWWKSQEITMYCMAEFVMYWYSSPVSQIFTCMDISVCIYWPPLPHPATNMFPTVWVGTYSISPTCSRPENRVSVRVPSCCVNFLPLSDFLCMCMIVPCFKSSPVKCMCMYVQHSKHRTWVWGNVGSGSGSSHEETS